MNKILKEPYLRSKLSEGRNFGIGFTFLELEKEGFKPLFPFTCCRDYLNDFTYIENTQKSLKAIHGFTHNHCDYLKGKRTFFMGVKALDYNTKSRTWGPLEEARKILLSNIENLIKNINVIEKEFSLARRTKYRIIEDTIVLEVPMFWIKSTPLISLYTLIIRCMFNYEGEYDKVKYLNHTTFIDKDMFYRINIVSALDNVESLKEVKKSTYKYPGTTCSIVHNHGIQGFIRERKLVMKTKKVA